MPGSRSLRILGKTRQYRTITFSSTHVATSLMTNKLDEPVMTTTIPPSPVNILMVDDQPSKLLSYEVMLGELGENLVKASSGREALELLLKMDFAVVLMDVSMPELDGFELAEMIRQHPRFQKTAIIFISAVHLTDVDRLKGYERGAVDYISVPIIPELLCLPNCTARHGSWKPSTRNFVAYLIV